MISKTRQRPLPSVKSIQNVGQAQQGQGLGAVTVSAVQQRKVRYSRAWDLQPNLPADCTPRGNDPGKTLCLPVITQTH